MWVLGLLPRSNPVNSPPGCFDLAKEPQFFQPKKKIIVSLSLTLDDFIKIVWSIMHPFSSSFPKRNLRRSRIKAIPNWFITNFNCFCYLPEQISGFYDSQCHIQWPAIFSSLNNFCVLPWFFWFCLILNCLHAVCGQYHYIYSTCVWWKQ